METIIETESIKVDLYVRVLPKPSLLSGFLSSVEIITDKEFEEFLKDQNDNSVTSLGTYPDPSSHPHSLLFLELLNFKPNYVYQVLQAKLHDRVLSKNISDKIVAKALEQRRIQSVVDVPLSVVVSVKLIQKVYNVVPCYSRDIKKQNEGEETCSICFENLLEDKSQICQMPNYCHLFHEDCVIQWLNRHNNSCPLCRQFVNKENQNSN